MTIPLKKKNGQVAVRQLKALGRQLVKRAASRFYVDPLLLAIGVFKDQQDYEQHTLAMVEQIKRGELRRAPEEDND